MKALFLVLLTLIPGFANASPTQHHVVSCAMDEATMSNIAESRKDTDLVEIQLLDESGAHAGSLFASWTNKGQLYGHDLYICGKGDNYFYVEAADIREWSGNEAEMKTVSVMQENATLKTDSIHHDEALSLVAVETLSRSKKSVEVRLIFQAWNFANEIATSGILTTTIPLQP